MLAVPSYPFSQTSADVTVCWAYAESFEDPARECVARAYLHRGRLGDWAAFEAAPILAADVDDPALLRLI